MICRLCLTESENIFAVFREEKIVQYIAKFLHLELTPDDLVSKVVCTHCWAQLDTFQIFYSRVKEAQKTLLTVDKELTTDVFQNGSYTDSDMAYAQKLLPRNSNIQSNMKLLKEEFLFKGSNGEAFHSLEKNVRNSDKEVVKVELNADEQNASNLSKANPSVVTRRLTRETNQQRQQITDRKLSSYINLKRKCRRSQKELFDELVAPAKDQAALEDTLEDANSKRKRNQPSKGEEKPNAETNRHTKTNRILETAKELDKIIQKNMDLVCNMCSAKVIDFVELKRHFRIVHNRKGYAICCNKRLYKRSLVVDHIKTHSNPEYFKCTECDKVLADRTCLRNHTLLLHQNEEDKVYQCPQCPKKYVKPYLLDRHQIQHVQTESFSCTDCGKKYSAKASLTKHFQKMHSKIDVQMCEICGKLIREEATFELHMEEHEGIVRPQIQCEECGSWFKNKNTLRMHMYKHDGKSYNCNVCGKSAPSKSAMQSHRKYVHQTVRQFQCTFCDKAFKRAISLREHLTTHTGEVLYTCPHCPKTFNSRANMHAHRKKKHRDEWEANRVYVK